MLLAVTKIQSQEIKELGEAQSLTNNQLAETSERLNVLIGTVERYIRRARRERLIYMRR